MITYSRGRIHILNLEQIRLWACECDEDVRSHYRRIRGARCQSLPFLHGSKDRVVKLLKGAGSGGDHENNRSGLSARTDRVDEGSP